MGSAFRQFVAPSLAFFLVAVWLAYTIGEKHGRERGLNEGVEHCTKQLNELRSEYEVWKSLRDAVTVEHTP